MSAAMASTVMVLLRHCFTNGSSFWMPIAPSPAVQIQYIHSLTVTLGHSSSHLIKVEFCRRRSGDPVLWDVPLTACHSEPLNRYLYPPDAITQTTPSGRRQVHAGWPRLPPARRPITTRTGVASEMICDTVLTTSCGVGWSRKRASS